MIRRILLFSILFGYSLAALGETCETNFFGPSITPKLNYWWSPTRFELTPRVEAFLADGAGRLAKARSEEASVTDQIRVAIAHVRRHVEYSEKCAANPPGTFDQVLHTRKGACLQINLLAAAVLTRAGFRAFVAYREVPAGWGHLWVEIGAGENALSVDATRENFVASRSEMERTSTHEASFERTWYLHPARILRRVQ